MKIFKEYFKDELKFLKEDGRQFTRLYPQLAKFLTEESLDPDAERILESFAFLSAKINKKIDDAFPELTFSLINILWPVLLKPVPSYAIAHFSLEERALSESITLPCGSIVYSHEINDIRCRFKTTKDLHIHPVTLTGTRWDTNKRSVVHLNFEKQENHKLNFDNFFLELYLNNNSKTAALNYKWIFAYTDFITITVDNKAYDYPVENLQKAGIKESEKLIKDDNTGFDGFRLLQEYFCYRQRFNFIRFTNLAPFIQNKNFTNLQISFQFNQPLEEKKHFQEDCFIDNCVPIINLYEEEAVPLLIKPQKSRYPIIPQTYQKEYIDIYDVVSVESSVRNDPKGSTTYYPYEQFAFEEENKAYYKHVIEPDFSEQMHSHHIEINNDENNHRTARTLSMNLRCTNFDLPGYLSIGDIVFSSQDIPSFLKVRNITKPTNYLLPVMDTDIHWQLIANFSLNYLSISDVQQFRKLLRIFDRRSMYDETSKNRVNRLLHAIESIRSEPYMTVYKSIVYRGIETSLSVKDAFDDEGELYVFSTIVSELFKKYAPINHYHKLTAQNLTTGEILSWKEHEGEQFVF